MVQCSTNDRAPDEAAEHSRNVQELEIDERHKLECVVMIVAASAVVAG